MFLNKVLLESLPKSVPDYKSKLSRWGFDRLMYMG